MELEINILPQAGNKQTTISRRDMVLGEMSREFFKGESLRKMQLVSMTKTLASAMYVVFNGVIYATMAGLIGAIVVLYMQSPESQMLFENLAIALENWVKGGLV